MLSLKDIAPSARNNINARFIILEKGTITSEGGGQNKDMFGIECDAFKPGDIVHLSNGIFSYSRSNRLVLRAGKRGKVEKVGEFTMAFVESPNMSEIVWVPDST
ncbi:putative nucleic acid-binding protein [Helianthus annuus]|nr:putative nucleic acid-binding protein [Helianthus annuus]